MVIFIVSSLGYCIPVLKTCSSYIVPPILSSTLSLLVNRLAPPPSLSSFSLYITLCSTRRLSLLLYCFLSVSVGHSALYIDSEVTCQVAYPLGSL